MIACDRFLDRTPVCTCIVQDLLIRWVATVALVVLAAKLAIRIPLMKAIRRRIGFVAQDDKIRFLHCASREALLLALKSLFECADAEISR